jgi:hypothetical protein
MTYWSRVISSSLPLHAVQRANAPAEAQRTLMQGEIILCPDDSLEPAKKLFSRDITVFQDYTQQSDADLFCGHRDVNPSVCKSDVAPFCLTARKPNSLHSILMSSFPSIGESFFKSCDCFYGLFLQSREVKLQGLLEVLLGLL